MNGLTIEKNKKSYLSFLGAEKRPEHSKGARWGLKVLGPSTLAEGQSNGSTLCSNMVDMSPMAGTMEGPKVTGELACAGVRSGDCSMHNLNEATL